jgi:lipoate-protein ligase A
MNMALDEALLVLIGRGESPPTLRLYGWSRPTVSLGYFQRASAEIDLEACSAAGVPVVRRPTGGRAVFHDDEVTYSVILPQACIAGSVLESYRVLSAGILQALSFLGLRGELACPGVRGPASGLMPAQRAVPQDGMQAACFDAPSWYETLVGGRKIIGSAQTRQGGGLLQHGSLLVGFDAPRLAGLLRSGARGEVDRADLALRLESRVTSLQAEMGRRPRRAEVQRAIACGMASALGLYLVQGGYTDKELTLARRLHRTKYRTKEWTMRR